MNRKIINLSFLLLSGLASCTVELQSETAVIPTLMSTTVPVSNKVTATETVPLPTATSTSPITTAVPTLTPIPTSRPPVTFAVPPEWTSAATETISQLQSNINWQYQISGSLESNIKLIEGTDGIIVFQQPLALAVPFTTNWENTTLSHAQEILTNGHSLAVIMPWNELTPQLKPLRIDGRHPTDPDYPLQTSWSLIAEPAYESAVAELIPVLKSKLNESVVKITAVGDLMLARDLGVIIERGRLAYPFAEVVDLLQAGDLTIGNMESALGTVGQPAEKSYPFEAPPAAAEALALAGFDIVTLANNHAMDYGPEALLEGLSLLHGQNLATIGAGANANAAYQPYFTDVNRLKLAFLGYVNVPIEGSSNFDVQTWTATQDAPGLAWGTPEQIFADVTAVSPQADLTIVILHSGLEYVEEPSEIQMAAAHAAIDGGADLVIGHHTHILQGIEFYNEGVIVYGLGNFAFDIDGPPATTVLNVWLNENGVHQLELIPAIIQDTGQPRPATPEEAAPILERVHFLTMLLNANRE